MGEDLRTLKNQLHDARRAYEAAEEEVDRLESLISGRRVDYAARLFRRFIGAGLMEHSITETHVGYLESGVLGEGSQRWGELHVCVSELYPWVQFIHQSGHERHSLKWISTFEGELPLIEPIQRAIAGITGLSLHEVK